MTSDNHSSYKLAKDSHKNRCTYNCGNCGINFSTELSLMLHIANAHPDNLTSLRVVREVTTIFRCRLCDDEFTYLSDFNSHMSVHGPRNKTTIPIIAERIQVTKQKVSPPDTKVTNTKKVSIQNRSVIGVPIHTRCFTCGKKFTESSGFTALDSVNFCILPTPECSKCNQTFPSRKELIEHNEIHTGHSETGTETCEMDLESAPIKLLKIEENANQQFKLYTCSVCNVKFANNITKAKKMLIPCANLNSQIAYGVPLSGPESEGESPAVSERLHQGASVTHSLLDGAESSSKCRTLDEENIKESPSVLVGLLQRGRMDTLQANTQSSESSGKHQESTNGENVMSGILPDGSEFVIMKTDPSEFDINTAKTNLMAQMWDTPVKVKIEKNVDVPSTCLKDSNVTDLCLTSTTSADLPPGTTIKPDPNAESIPIQTGVANMADKKSVKTEVIDNSYESDGLNASCPNMSRNTPVTRSMRKKQMLHSNVSDVKLTVEKSVPYSGKKPTRKSLTTHESESVRNSEQSESDLDSLLAVQKPLEGVSDLQLNITSNDSQYHQRVLTNNLDKLLSIEKPFLYDASPEKRDAEKDQLVIKTEPGSPVVESTSRHVTGRENENIIEKTSELAEESLTSPENVAREMSQVSDSQVAASSSDDNTVFKNRNTETSPLLKSVKTEPDADSWPDWELENSLIRKTTESEPANTTGGDDQTEHPSLPQLQGVKLENGGGEEDITQLPKISEIKQEKEDLSYEQCADRFPGIDPDSDSSSDELQDSRDPNLYSASQIKQESDDSHGLLKIKRDLFCKKGEKRKFEDEMSEGESNIDSPYLQSPVDSIDQTSQTELCSTFPSNKPIERIFVPQSMLGVHRMQLNDVLNNVKQKQVESGSDIVDLLNEEALPEPNRRVRWRKNYRKRIADLMAGKEMTMESRAIPRKYPNVQYKRRHAHADLLEIHMAQRAKQRSTKRSYYGRKIAELTALNKGLQVALSEKIDKYKPEKPDLKVNTEVETAENSVDEDKPQTHKASLEEQTTEAIPTKRRNFYEKRIAELRAFEDVDILESETVSVRLSKDSAPETHEDGEEEEKRKIDYKKRMADLNKKLKAIREGQRLKKSKLKTKERCVCPTCDKVFDDQDSIVEHMRTVHGSKVVYKCDFCTRMFETKEDKVQHQFVHIEETKSVAYKMLQSDQFTCNICNTSFLFSQSLVDHFRKFHSEDQLDPAS